MDHLLGGQHQIDTEAQEREEAGLAATGEECKTTRMPQDPITLARHRHRGGGEDPAHTRDHHHEAHPEDEARRQEALHGGDEEARVTVLGAATVEAEVGQGASPEAEDDTEAGVEFYVSMG